MDRRHRPPFRMLAAAIATSAMVAGLSATGTAPAAGAPAPMAAGTPAPEVVADIDGYATGLTLHDGRLYTITSAAVDSREQAVLSVDRSGGNAQETPLTDTTAFTATALTVDASGAFYFNGYTAPDEVTGEPRYQIRRYSPAGASRDPRNDAVLPYREAHGLAQDGRRLYFVGAHDLPQTTDGYLARLKTTNRLRDQEHPEVFLGGQETSADCHPSWAGTSLACMSEPGAFAFVGDQVWVADALSGVITVFDPLTGAVAHRYGLGPASPADHEQIDQVSFTAPSALAGDEDGNAYVTDDNGAATHTYKVTADATMYEVTDDPVADLAVDPATGDLFALNRINAGHARIVRYAGTAGLGKTVPGAPTGLTTAYGFESAQVSFTAPADDGNDTIVDYRVSAHLQGSTDPEDTVVAWGESSPITVAGIDEGTWELSVQAENSVGFGAAATATQLVRRVGLDLDVTPTSGTAPFFATLDASGSSIPPGSAPAFHCGDTFAPAQVAADGLSAQCKYNNASPSGGFRARVTLADPVAGITLSDEERVTVAGAFVPGVNLQADVDSGTAPLTVHLDATDSSAPQGATFEFHCGDSHDIDQAYSTDRTATCRYDRESPGGGWNAFVRMRDPATGRTYESTVPITVAPAPHTVDGSAAFDRDRPLLDVTVAPDGGLGSNTCGEDVHGVYCATLYGVTIRLAAGPGTFQPGTHVLVYGGDREALQSELGDDVEVQGGFAVTWEPRQDLAQPLVVTIPKATAAARAARTTDRWARAFSFDPLGFVAGLAEGLVDGVVKVAQTAGAIIQAAANAISSLWNSSAQVVRRPNGADVNGILTCASIGRDDAGHVLCGGPYTWQKDVPSTVMQAMTAGSRVIAAGGGNVIASGGGNVIAAGGGNVIAAGGGNLRITGNAVIAAGGGNVIAAGGGNVIAAGGGNVIAAGGGNVIAAGGGNLNMTLTRDPGVGFAEPKDHTPPKVAATVDADRARVGGVYPEGTKVTVHLRATSPASPAIDITRIDYVVDGPHPVAHTIAPGERTDVVLDQPGTYTITYGAQDASLNDATPATTTVRIAGATGDGGQAITFPVPSGVEYGDRDLPLHASSSSGAPVRIASKTGSVCSVAGGKVHVRHAGTCRLVATSGAASRTVAFRIAKAKLRVSAASAAAARKGRKPAIAPIFRGFVNRDSIFTLDRAPVCKAVRGRHGRVGTTRCAGARDRDYAITYRAGTLKVAKNGYAVLSASRAYLKDGFRTTFRLAASGPKHSIRVAGRLPAGLRVVHDRSWSKVKITGTPKRPGRRTVKVTVRRGGHVKAVQRLVIEIDR